jgi:hypothetical protein
VFVSAGNNVSRNTLDRASLALNRQIKCRDPANRKARYTTAITNTVVFPDLDPPNNKICFAPPLISANAFFCALVGLNIPHPSCKLSAFLSSFALFSFLFAIYLKLR